MTHSNCSRILLAILIKLGGEEETCKTNSSLQKQISKPGAFTGITKALLVIQINKYFLLNITWLLNIFFCKNVGYILKVK